MNLHSEAAIRARARRAYELSRAGNALALGSIVAVPAVMVSMHCCSTPRTSVLCGLGLGATIVAARFIGLKAQSALRPGLMAGLLAFSFPAACSLLICQGGVCTHLGVDWLPYVVIIAAFVGGVAMRLSSRDGLPLVAGSTALMFGSLGSLVVGLYGPVLTAAGLAAGGVFAMRAFGRRSSV